MIEENKPKKKKTERKFIPVKSKKGQLIKTYSFDKDGEWEYTWRNGVIIRTKLTKVKKQPKRKKKNRNGSVPGQFI